MTPVKFSRHGRCDACGLCCEFFVVFGPFSDEAIRDPIFHQYLELHGLTVHGSELVTDGIATEPVEYGGVKATKVMAPCKAFQDGKCSIYESRPIFCKGFPHNPLEFIGLKRCSYWFTAKGHEFYAQEH